MCQFKSMIILKDRIFIPDYDSHTDMLEELGIEDTYENAATVFVRAELTPVDGDKFSPIESWEFIVDQDIVPEKWFVLEYEKERAIAAIKEWASTHIYIGAKNIRINGGICLIKKSIVKACDNSKVYAYGNSTVYAYDNSTVYARGNSTVYACGNNRVYARGNSTVYAYGNSMVYAYNNSMVYAYDNSSVYAYDNSMVYAYGNSRVYAYGNSRVEAWRNSVIEIPRLSSNVNEHIKIEDDAILINYREQSLYSRKDWGALLIK